MLDTITNILNKQLYPLNTNNIQEPYIYNRKLQDIEIIKPNFESIYQVYFQEYPYIPPKAKFYFYLINNDIAYLLNTYIAKKNENPSEARIAYWHSQVKKAIDGTIYHFHKTILNNNLSLKKDDSIGFAHNDEEKQTFALICYYAISALACTYLHWLAIYKDKLQDVELHTNPYEYIYSVIFTPLPQGIYIEDKTINEPTAKPQGGNTYNYNIQGNVGQVIGKADQVNTTQDEQRQ